MARMLFQKGAHFVGAAILLRQHGGNEFVVLHLLCQGIEIILKALLALKDYSKYQPALKKYRHNLIAITNDVIAEFHLHPLRPAVSAELEELNRMYSRHLLRYDLLTELFINPASIPSRLVVRRTAAVLRLAHRELARMAE
jgi:hypothetical protein